MGREPRNKRQHLQERMGRLMRLIKDNKFSDEKRIKLESDYCYLQRDLKIIESYQKMRNKNAAQPKKEVK